jgi:hypothetical protein
VLKDNFKRKRFSQNTDLLNQNLIPEISKDSNIKNRKASQYGANLDLISRLLDSISQDNDSETNRKKSMSSVRHKNQRSSLSRPSQQTDNTTLNKPP